MKNKLFKRVLIILLAMFLCVFSLIGCSKNKEKESDDTVKEKESVQLLGFESYEEFTGAKIRIGNQLGRMEINADKKYISQGEGSLLVKPQGDYSEPRKYPYLQLDFLNTTCATCDFSEFRDVSFDVFNATDEELHVRVSLSVGKDDGIYTTTSKFTYDLKEKGWTTCTYDISEMSSYPYYDFQNVRYMTIEFMEKKDSKDDVPNELYIDNLVGNYYQYDDEKVSIEYDFYEGITFEKSADQYLVFGETYVKNKMEFSRVAYTKDNIKVASEMGEYGMRADATGSIWPRFTVRFGEEIPENTIFTFMAYIEVDAAEEDSFKFESYSSSGANIISVSDIAFNEWVQISIQMKDAADVLSGFFNFDDYSDPNGKSRFGSKKPVIIYMDNFRLTEYVDPLTLAPENPNYTGGITFEDEAEQYLIANNAVASHQAMSFSRIEYAQEGMKVGSEYGKYGMKGVVKGAAYPAMTVYYKKEIPAGTVLNFKAYVKGDASKASAVKVESFGNTVLTGNIPLNRWVEIQIKLNKSAEFTELFFNFDNGTDSSYFGQKEVLIYMDNFKLTGYVDPLTLAPANPDYAAGITFEDEAEKYLLANNASAAHQVMDLFRIKYSEEGMTVDSNYGTYGMKGIVYGAAYPHLTIYYKKEIPAGTVLSYMAYVKGDKSMTSAVKIESPGNTVLSGNIPLNQWVEIRIKLNKATKYTNLFFNFDNGTDRSYFGQKEVLIYMDNLKLEQPAEPEGDFYEGVGFEAAGNAGLFAGWKVSGLEWQDAEIDRVAYTSAGISAPADGGTYGLTIGHRYFGWPHFKVNLGEEVPAGTKLTFMAYGTVEGAAKGATTSFSEMSGTNETKSNTFKLGEWSEISITLSEATDTLLLYWSYGDAGGTPDGPGKVYVDNFKLERPAEPEGDFYEGVGFEAAGNAGLFAGWKVSGLEWQDAEIDRVAYTSAGISAPADGGTYGLTIGHRYFGWPHFKVNLGEEVPAGTTLTFMAYGTVEGAGEGAATSFTVITGDTNKTKSNTFKLGEWSEISITLPEATDTLLLYWSYGDAGGTPDGPGKVYVDNFKLERPAEPEGDFYEGVGFEAAGNVGLFAGWKVSGLEWQDAEIDRVAYTSAGISAPADGGTYALTIGHRYFGWPHFKMNLGEEVPAGTTLTFMAYGTVEGAGEGAATSFTVITGDTNKTKSNTFKLGEWSEISITLPEATDTLLLYWSYGDAGGTPDGPGKVYVDNFKLERPAEPEGDFYEGVGFEAAGNAGLFEGWKVTNQEWADATIERISYTTAGISAPENGGAYALKLSHPYFGWPRVRVNLGEEVPAGTTLTFMAYGTVEGAGEGAATSFTVKTGDTNKTKSNTFKLGEWSKISITLPEATDTLLMYWSYGDAGGTPDGPGKVYVDNFKLERPAEPEGDFYEGVGFEAAGNVGLFAGWEISGSEYADAEIDRVAYTSAGISAPADGGTYGLKISHSYFGWPHFKVNLGEEVPAGTKLTFMAYGTVEGAGEGAATSFTVKTGDTNKTKSNTFKLGEWSEISITLPEATDTLLMYWSYGDAGGTPNGPGKVYVDNFKLEQPAESKNDFYNGVGFEVAGNVGLFAGWEISGSEYADAEIDRVAYTSAGISAPADGGTYGLKISHSYFGWPHFKVNLGEEVPAGTKLTFMAYGTVEGAGEGAATSFTVKTGDTNKTKSNTFKLGEWSEISITLPEATDTLLMYWSYGDAGGTPNGPGKVYVDNFKLEQPAESKNDFYNGVGFEVAGNVGLFAGWEISGSEYADAEIDRVAYTSAGISAPADGGTYGLKISHSYFGWPHFKVNLGEEVPAGTKLIFMAYGTVEGAGEGAATSFTVKTGDTNKTKSNTFKLGEWSEISITLPEATDTLLMYWSYGDAGGTPNGPGKVYVDNFKLEQPAESKNDFYNGVRFEVAENVGLFAGWKVSGLEWQDAEIDRVAYTSAGISAPADGGTYALTIGHRYFGWPHFKVNLGEEVPAGTKLTFMAYGTVEGAGEGAATSFTVKTGDTNKTKSNTFKLGEWSKISITLPEATDTLYLYWSYGDAGGTPDGPGKVYVDNFKLE